MPGPRIRTDIVDVHVFRRCGAGGAVEFLQLHRIGDRVMSDTWQPVMGHVEGGETAAQAALRELQEETAYAPGRGLLNFWQLEMVNTYFLARYNDIVMAPGFVAEVAAGQEPVLDHTHDQFRWVVRDQAAQMFMWPGHRQAIAQIIEDILTPGALAEPVLRIPL